MDSKLLLGAAEIPPLVQSSVFLSQVAIFLVRYSQHKNQSLFFRSVKFKFRRLYVFYLWLWWNCIRLLNFFGLSFMCTEMLLMTPSTERANVIRFMLRLIVHDQLGSRFQHFCIALFNFDLHELLYR